MERLIIAGSWYRPKDTDSTWGTRPTEQSKSLQRGAGTSRDGSTVYRGQKEKGNSIPKVL